MTYDIGDAHTLLAQKMVYSSDSMGDVEVKSGYIHKFDVTSAGDKKKGLISLGLLFVLGLEAYTTYCKYVLIFACNCAFLQCMIAYLVRYSAIGFEVLDLEKCMLGNIKKYPVSHVSDTGQGN